MKQNAFRLAPTQARLWRLQSHSDSYRSQVAVRLSGSVQPELLYRAIEHVIDQHEALRTIFLLHSTFIEPLQSPQPTLGFEWQEDDLSSSPESTTIDRAVVELLQSERSVQLDLKNGPLIRVRLVTLERTEFLLIVTMPVVCCDSQGLNLFMRTLARQYNAMLSGKRESQEVVQYLQFSEWLNDVVGDHLRKETDQDTQPILLPLERAQGGSDIHTLATDLNSHVVSKIDHLSRALSVTTSSVILAGWQTLLWRLSAQTDLQVKAVIEGRAYEELKETLGLFNWTVPIRVECDGNRRFCDLVTATHQALHQASESIDISVCPENRLSHARPIGFEFIEWQPITFSGVATVLTSFYSYLEDFKLSLTVIRAENKLHMTLNYDPRSFTGRYVEWLGERLRTVLEAGVEQADRKLDELRVVGGSEQQWQLQQAVGPVRQSGGGTLAELFEEAAARVPGSVAVRSGGRELSYRELEQRANQLAARLRGRGVGPEVRVGVSLKRSVELVVALLGVLKAGGAYVALEAEAGWERQQWIVKDAGVELVITEASERDRWESAGVAVLRVEEEWEESGGERREGASAEAENLAYVIYTSGSTGRPKGVAVTHAGLVNYLRWCAAEYEVEAGAVLHSPLTFDLTVTSLWGPLVSGGAVEIVGTGVEELAAAVRKGEGRVLKLTPAHLVGLQELVEKEARAGQRRVIVIGGEALTGALVKGWGRGAGERLINEYGPTETVVGSCVYEVQAGDEEEERIPIGRPIANTEAYVLDERMELAPVGVTGELYLGGQGVARGYLGRAELTAAAFVPHPFSREAGARLYRTGDVVRYRVDGELEYVGRVDEQVKIRGYRIEPGEVEVVLGEHERVRAAAVVVSEQGGVGKRLEAYVEAEAGPEISVAELGAYLGERLPAYMVPGRIEVLRSLPLTANGKVDRRRLREQGGSDARRSRYRGPESEAEEQLARIWGEVLKLERVGIDDNFFELGGDSILSIQVVARAKEAGLQLTPREVFQHPTIARLAGRAGAVAAEVSVAQGLVSGVVPLTPIQRWFFAQEHQNPHHWNQAVVLGVRAEVTAGELEEGLNLLLLHHDALRLRFRPQAGEWEQENEGAGERLKLAHHDLAVLSEEQQRAALKAEAEQLQAGLNISSGPLVAGSVFELGGGERRLVLVIHHLVVDGVSWRILLEDLQSICRQMRRGEAVRLPAKTTSYKEWAERLVAYAQSAELVGEQSYWVEKSEQRYGKVPVDHAGGANTVGSGAEVTTELSAAETQALLQAVPVAYRCSINEALLWSLVSTLRGWTGADTVRVELESHGREELWEAVDVTRTVGWFTTRTLVQVSVAAGTSNEAGLKQVKAELRGLKRQGLDYGVLRYLSEGAVAQQLGASGEAEVSFNYLGQLDQAEGAGALLELSSEELGSPQAEENQRSNLIQLNSRVSGGQLRVSWNYSRNLHERESIEAVAGQYQEGLRELLRGASEERPGAYTASDFPLVRVREEELERVLQARAGVENLYRLSGVQQGMIFHTLYAPGTGMYVGQLTCRVEGELAEAAFAEAWQRVVAKHEVLRSSYEWEGVSELLAVVQKAVTVEVELVDWREAESQAEQLERYLEEDRRRGFDLRQAPLMRVKLLRLAEKEWQIVWTNHHIILDGWSNGLVLADVLSCYQQLLRKETVAITASRPYRDYIEWLEQQDKEGARQYWQQRLAGFAGRNQLQIERGAGSRVAVGQSSRKQQRELSAAVTKQLVEYGRAHGLTMNTLVQGAWAIVLGEYSRQQDLVYGAVVSGRPAELVGVETMVGLFINTVPVRVKLETEKPLVDWLQEHQAAQVEMMQYEYTPLGQIQSWAQVPASEPLFETLFVFENFPRDQLRQAQLGGLAIHDLEMRLTEHYPLVLTVRDAAELFFFIRYDQDRFSSDDVSLLLDALVVICEQYPTLGETPVNTLPGHVLDVHYRAKYHQAYSNTSQSMKRQPVTINPNEG